MFFLLLTPLVMFHPQTSSGATASARTAIAAAGLAIDASWRRGSVATSRPSTSRPILAVGPGLRARARRTAIDTYSGDLSRLLVGRSCDDGTTWPDDPDADESVIGAAKLREGAEAYIGDHLGEVSRRSIAARVGRILGLYRPFADRSTSTSSSSGASARTRPSDSGPTTWRHGRRDPRRRGCWRRRSETLLPTLAVTVAACVGAHRGDHVRASRATASAPTSCS